MLVIPYFFAFIIGLLLAGLLIGITIILVQIMMMLGHMAKEIKRVFDSH